MTEKQPTGGGSQPSRSCRVGLRFSSGREAPRPPPRRRGRQPAGWAVDWGAAAGSHESSPLPLLTLHCAAALDVDEDAAAVDAHAVAALVGLF